ncbi:MAG TPA: aspartate kinase, partial [Thiotrichales bacterium]|nr:aspartate kinase [Thiotrichales bacterium]
MALIVQKYGGTSIGTVDRIQNVAKKIKKWREQGNELVIVVSAMSGETNRLIGLAQQITAKPNPRELDMILTTGEQVTIGLLAIALESIGVPAISFTGQQVG